jgi:hypothetical protein
MEKKAKRAEQSVCKAARDEQAGGAHSKNAPVR